MRTSCFLAPSQNLYYSLWHYSADSSKIGLQVQSRRSPKSKLNTEKFFGLVLRESRKANGLTQEDLAYQSGYHPTYIGQLERGAKSPSLRTIITLAKTLNIPASELVARVEVLVGEAPPHDY